MQGSSPRASEFTRSGSINFMSPFVGVKGPSPMMSQVHASLSLLGGVPSNLFYHMLLQASVQAIYHKNLISFLSVCFKIKCDKLSVSVTLSFSVSSFSSSDSPLTLFEIAFSMS